MLLKLFLIFLKIGTFSIGGGYAIIPFIQEEIVIKYQWISNTVFNDIITISQMTPGPLAVNTSTFVGLQVNGLLGAIIATLGCVISGVLIALVLHRFFQKHRSSTWVLHLLNNLKILSVGLIASACGVILLSTFFGVNTLSTLDFNQLFIDYWAIFMFIISLLAIRKFKMNPLLIMVICGFSTLLIK